MARVLVLLADGCEEIEAVTIIDVLRRAQWDVVGAGLKPGPVTASRGVRLVPDTTIDAIDAASFDAIALPGGNGGTQQLMDDARVLKLLREFNAAGKLVAAICAAPKVLHKAGLLSGKFMTCYPGVEREIAGAKHLEQHVVQDGNVVTSRGPGTTLPFALALIERFDGKEKAKKVAGGLLVSFG